MTVKELEAILYDVIEDGNGDLPVKHFLGSGDLSDYTTVETATVVFTTTKDEFKGVYLGE